MHTCVFRAPQVVLASFADRRTYVGACDRRRQLIRYRAVVFFKETIIVIRNPTTLAELEREMEICLLL